MKCIKLYLLEKVVSSSSLLLSAWLLRVGVLEQSCRWRPNRHQLALAILIAKDNVVSAINHASHSAVLVAAQNQAVPLAHLMPMVLLVLPAMIEDALIRRRRCHILGMCGRAQQLLIAAVQSSQAAQPPGRLDGLSVGRATDAVPRPLVGLVAGIDVAEQQLCGKDDQRGGKAGQHYIVGHHQISVPQLALRAAQILWANLSAGQLPGGQMLDDARLYQIKKSNKSYKLAFNINN